MTKEELIAENATLRKQNEHYITQDKAIRDEFAKAFNWYKPHGGYRDERLPATPTWEKVFVQLGSLLAARNFMDFEGNISELECAVDAIRVSLKEQN